MVIGVVFKMRGKKEEEMPRGMGGAPAPEEELPPEIPPASEEVPVPVEGGEGANEEGVEGYYEGEAGMETEVELEGSEVSDQYGTAEESGEGETGVDEVGSELGIEKGATDTEMGADTGDQTTEALQYTCPNCNTPVTPDMAQCPGCQTPLSFE